jgi:hypothetical protein
MDRQGLAYALLHTEWISWIIHFVMFLVLSRWSGIKWRWAVLIVLAIEVWETADWSPDRPWRWWMRFDTHADIVCGCLGIWAGEALKRTASGREP